MSTNSLKSDVVCESDVVGPRTDHVRGVVCGPPLKGGGPPTPKPRTSAGYRSGKRTTCVNPFSQRLRARQAAAGGKHAPSRVGGRLFDAEEVSVSMKREAFQLRDQVVSPF